MNMCRKCKIFIVWLFCICFCVSCKNNEVLFPIKIDKSYGYINSEGKLIIPALYSIASPFSDGLAVVKYEKEWLCIDKNGSIVFSIEADFVWPFSEGVACIRKDKKCGYINKTGKLIIPCQYAYASAFSNGLACVSTDFTRTYIGETFFYIDKKGKNIFNKYWKNCAPFNEGYGVCRDIEENVILINKKGSVLDMPTEFRITSFKVSNNIIVGLINEETALYKISEKYCLNLGKSTAVDDFSEGFAVITVFNKNQSLYGVIDTDGKTVISPQYAYLGPVNDGLLEYAENNLSGFININQQVIIPKQFNDVLPFSNGMAVVNPRDGKNGGYVTKENKIYRGKDYL